jgi:hypothetical protein
MKGLILLIGLVAGTGIGILWTRSSSLFPEKAHWNWPDSLDAVRAAPHNHRVIFENSQVRILEVILEPYEFESMHTHSNSSVMFGADIDTPPFDIVYYTYGFDPANHHYILKDSIRKHQSGHDDSTGGANFMKPEGPHRVKNLNNVRVVAYRVEFKSGQNLGTHN